MPHLCRTHVSFVMIKLSSAQLIEKLSVRSGMYRTIGMGH